MSQIVEHLIKKFKGVFYHTWKLAFIKPVEKRSTGRSRVDLEYNICMTKTEFLHQLLTLPTVNQALLSPDGKWVAYEWYRIHENLDVFLVPSDGSAAPLALTHTPEATQLVSWAPDSRSVLVSEDHGRDERAWLLQVEIDRPGVMIPLTEDRPAYFLRGGSLSADGQALYYGANYDFAADRPIEPTWIYRHDLVSGIRTAVARPVKPVYMVVSLNRQGTRLLYCRKERSPAGRQFWLVGIDGEGDREILNFGDGVKTFARWLPDGERILVLSESNGSGKQMHYSLGMYHWPSGSLRWLIDDPRRAVESAWVSPDGAVVVDEIRQGRHAPTVLDPESGLEQAFPELPGNLLPVGRAADGAWIGLYYASNAPAELVRFGLDARTPQDMVSLTRAWRRTGLQADQLAQASDFSWISLDGLEIHGWLYKARQWNGRAILYIHGGPSMHSEDKLNPGIQYYCARGFNVLDINYRGSTGYGMAFREAIKVDGWGGREQADISTAAQALVQAGLALPGQVGVTGTSYGGYSAWCQITGITGGADNSLIGASAPICGMTDLVVDYNTTRPDLRPLSEEMIGGSPAQVPEKYAARSPINFVEKIRGRVLIVQGALDPNVSPQNMRDMVERLAECQVPYQVLEFADEGHGITKPVNQEKLYPVIADFFEERLNEEND